jgi:hypothetical protein
VICYGQSGKEQLSLGHCRQCLTLPACLQLTPYRFLPPFTEEETEAGGGFEPRALRVLGECCTSELHPSPKTPSLTSGSAEMAGQGRGILVLSGRAWLSSFHPVCSGRAAAFPRNCR